MDRSSFRLDDIEKTWIFDLDGTLVVHNGYKNGVDELLPSVKEFYEKAENKKITLNLTKTENDLCFSDLNYFKEQNLNQLDLKKSAYRQLLSENIPNTNIDISNLCTYKFKNEFNSWRKNKTISRQWNFICT